MADEQVAIDDPRKFSTLQVGKLQKPDNVHFRPEVRSLGTPCRHLDWPDRMLRRRWNSMPHALPGQSLEWSVPRSARAAATSGWS